MKVLRKKWDFWYWFVFIIYFIVGFFYRISQPDDIMGLKFYGVTSFAVISIGGAVFIWSIIEAIQICITKFKTSQIMKIRIVYAILIAALIYLLTITIHYMYLWVFFAQLIE